MKRTNRKVNRRGERGRVVHGSNGGIRGVQRVFPAPPVSRGENAREGGFELCRQIKPAKGAAKPLRIRWIDTREKEYLVFFFNDTATTEIYTLSLHDALPI